MSLPPAILKLSVTTQTGRRACLWLPVFLLWPLVLAIGIIGLAFAVAADVVLALIGRPFHRYVALLIRALAILSEARGTAINVSTATSTVAVTVK